MIDLQLQIQGPVGKALVIAFVAWMLLTALEELPIPPGRIAVAIKAARVAIVVTACLIILWLPS